MATQNRKRSTRSGRADGLTTHDSGWLNPALQELRNVITLTLREHGEEHRLEIEHAVSWSANWLLAYDSGTCTLHELLDVVRRVAKNLPPIIPRLLLGVVAHKALLTTPRRLGEHKSKTVPVLMTCIGSQVQGFLFDDAGNQVCTIDEAVSLVRQFIIDRDLLPEHPTESMIKQWHVEWRAQEDARGEAVVARPKAGRPKKKG